jgi:hypothetical protein
MDRESARPSFDAAHDELQLPASSPAVIPETAQPLSGTHRPTVDLPNHGSRVSLALARDDSRALRPAAANLPPYLPDLSPPAHPGEGRDPALAQNLVPA